MSNFRKQSPAVKVESAPDSSLPDGLEEAAQRVQNARQRHQDIVYRRGGCQRDVSARLSDELDVAEASFREIVIAHGDRSKLGAIVDGKLYVIRDAFLDIDDDAIALAVVDVGSIIGL
jgi:hypothetical protein